MDALGLALRGHRDSGELLIDESFLGNLNYDQGNFRALLQLMINSGDKTLYDHLKNSAKNALHISSLTQNHLIDAINTHMLTQIGEEVRQARYFSLLADETTDSSHKDQLCICSRYLYKNKLNKRFLCFAEADDLTGSGLAKQLLKTLQEFGIDKIIWLNKVAMVHLLCQASETASKNTLRNSVLVQCIFIAHHIP